MSSGGRGGDRGGSDSSRDGFVDRTVQIKRCAAVVKGGRRFSFAAMVVVGDGKGRVGRGYGYGSAVPPCVEKAQKQAMRSMINVPVENGTIAHRVQGHYGAARVILLPASSGTGVIAGAAVRAVGEEGDHRLVAGERRARVAFFPFNAGGGGQIPNPQPPTLPVDVYSLGDLSNPVTNVLYRVNAGGPAGGDIGDGVMGPDGEHYGLAVPDGDDHGRQPDDDRSAHSVSNAALGADSKPAARDSTWKR